MKKVFIFAAACVLSFLASGGRAAAQFSLSAGYEYSRYAVGGETDGNPFDGFTGEVGYTARFMNRMLGVNFAAAYTFSTRNNGKTAIGTSGTQEQIVTVPLRLVVDLPVNDFGICFTGGGYAAYYLSGTDSYTMKLESSSINIIHDYLNGGIESDIDMPDFVLKDVTDIAGDSCRRRHDCGVQIGAGIRIRNAAMIGATWSRSLLNRYSDPSEGNMRREAFCFRLTFLF